MTFQNPLLVVTDLARSIAFYRQVLGLDVVLDFGANVTLTGGVWLQTLESWAGFLGEEPENITPGGNGGELYFEEERFDEFLQRLAAVPNVRYVHPVIEHRWGQRVVRFYDPDRHIIEVGEKMSTVCRRFWDAGMTVPQIARRMDVPQQFVADCLREAGASRR